MHVRFLLGPAGSGKTYRCLEEIRAALRTAPEGPPLVFLAPKQATFQLERQLLADPDLPGYTRLQILSFERLADFLLSEFASVPPRLLDEEGRIMLLRAILAKRRAELQVFRASARLPGFAGQLSQFLRELQQHRLTPCRLAALASRVSGAGQLDAKLRDVALLLQSYLDTLKQLQLQDADVLLDRATDAFRVAAGEAVVNGPESKDNEPEDDLASCPVLKHRPTPLLLGGLWLDGFAQMTPQERRLLGVALQCAERTTLAFCLEREPGAPLPWHSPWSLVGATYLKCREEFAVLPGVEFEVETLSRNGAAGRFAQSPMLQHLERHWSDVTPWTSPVADGNAVLGAVSASSFGSAIRLIECANPEAEVVVAARRILRYVRDEGGRFRDVAILLRSLDGYVDAIDRVFPRYGIEFFLDRREPVAHHPLAELARFALRTVAFDWRRDDWFGVLKTGLTGVSDTELDWLENEALARGWEGRAWREPFVVLEDLRTADRLRAELVPPFLRFAGALGDRALGSSRSADGFAHLRPNGEQLAEAYRELFRSIQVERTLERWCADSAAGSSGPAIRQPAWAVHQTVWQQTQQWLDNLALAFRDEAMPVRDWLPILEAGLSALSVGVIPPALDQVLVGTIDRSRNPDLQLALVLGLNENVFPAVPGQSGLLSPADRETLAAFGTALGPDRLQQIGLERFYGYIACTRARRDLVLTYARRDARDKNLNPSLFIDQIRRLFPDLATETIAGPHNGGEVEHARELIVPLLRAKAEAAGVVDPRVSALEAWPELRPALLKWSEVGAARAGTNLSPARVEALYGRDLATSVSALEEFAACPFKFFVARGLRAEERIEFEVDYREKGSFQHQVLEEFHRSLKSEGRRWRDVTPSEARQRIRAIGESLLPAFRDGLFVAAESRRFAGGTLIEALEKLVETLVGWTRQYRFDPQAVEVSFGLKDSRLPAWRLELEDGHALLLRGRIDRVDLGRPAGSDHPLAVIIDYKSSARELDRVRLENGLELQLLSYLGALAQFEDLTETLNTPRVMPGGVFYVGLKGGGGSARTRDEEQAQRAQARTAGYQHRGRFDGGWLRWFDDRDVVKGDQFRYKLNKDGSFSKVANEAMPTGDFAMLLERVRGFLRAHGNRIYAGETQASPFRHKNKTACDYCEYRAICRFDPWTQPFRMLKPAPKPGEAGRAVSSSARTAARTSASP